MVGRFAGDWVEQVVDEVAPVTAEYVPAKARDEEYAYIDSNTSV
jgi:hypothetical protein